MPDVWGCTSQVLRFVPLFEYIIISTYFHTYTVHVVQRMEEGRLPKQAMKWNPPGRRKRGRPKLTWAEGIRGLMGEKGLVEEYWNDRDEWRKKIL